MTPGDAPLVAQPTGSRWSVAMIVPALAIQKSIYLKIDRRASVAGRGCNGSRLTGKDSNASFDPRFARCK